VAVLAREGRLEEIPGVGEDLSAMICEYLRSGKVCKYEQARKGSESCAAWMS
jgi:hypothetical protein